MASGRERILMQYFFSKTSFNSNTGLTDSEKETNYTVANSECYQIVKSYLQNTNNLDHVTSYSIMNMQNIAKNCIFFIKKLIHNFPFPNASMSCAEELRLYQASPKSL